MSMGNQEPVGQNSPEQAAFDVEHEVNTRNFQIVIADDDPDARTLLEIALSGSNLDLSIFDNGDSALEACQANPPDLAVLDIQMPGANGIEVCQALKAKSPEFFIPVILLTAQAELTDKVNGLNCGADDYVTKPFNVAELEARVRALLRIKVLTDQLRKTQNMLQQKEKELVAMHVAGAAAHELGQPLTTVMLSFQLLKSLDKENPKFGATMEQLAEQFGRMKAILQKLNEVKEYKTISYPGDMEILDIGSDS
jgi:DNA-binding response OmpR family regulator